MQLLHLEDSPLDHDLVCRALTKQGLDCEVTRVETLEGKRHEDADNIRDAKAKIAALEAAAASSAHDVKELNCLVGGVFF
jgi:hypothetical protein